MRRWFCGAVIILILTFFLIGCSKDKTSPEENTPKITAQSEKDSLNQESIGQEEVLDVPEEKQDLSDDTNEEVPANSPVDMDLSGFNSNILYAEVYNMLLSPEDYIGKRIKLPGQFSYYQKMDENYQPVPGTLHVGCLVSDTLGCCSLGVDFNLKEEHVFPEDYPEVGTDISITGVCDIYFDENEFVTVICLNDAEMEILS